MTFFKRFDNINYDPDNIGKRNAVNITNSLVMKYSPIKDTTLYFNYTIQDGEKPEDVSYKHYGTSQYHWILVLINDVVDQYYDWLLSAKELESYMEDKYGDDLYDVHHFTNLTTGKRVDEFDELGYREDIDNEIALPVYIHPVSNREYEIGKNEEKRLIKVISPNYINDVITQFEEIMDN